MPAWVRPSRRQRNKDIGADELLLRYMYGDEKIDGLAPTAAGDYDSAGVSNLKLAQMGRKYLATLLKIFFERLLIADDIMAETVKQRYIADAARTGEDTATQPQIGANG